MSKLKKPLTVLVLFSLVFFSLTVLFQKDEVKEAKAASGGSVSLLCDYESCVKKSGNVYVTLSKGNMAYVYVLLEGVGSNGVTIYYHTESGSAVAGQDYTEIQGESVYSGGGGSTRTVRIAVYTNTCDIALRNYNGMSYVSRSFFVALDRAVYDDGTELQVSGSSYSANNKSFSTSDKTEVMLKGNNEINCEGNRFTVYNKTMSADFGWSEVDSPDGVYVNDVFINGDPEMDKIKKLGFGDYYATCTCTLSEVQDSEEETTRFIFGNNNWAHYGGASCATRGTGWFYGVEIKYDNDRIWNDQISAIVENNDPGRFVASAKIDNYNYVKVGNTYYFLNSESPACGFSVFRHDETDGDSDIYVSVYQKCIDATKPVVKDLYLDTTSVYMTEGKYRLAVRFSEPVYNASNTKIMGETNNYTRLRFDYAGGNGTDTIFYDCDTSNYENLSIKKITFNNAVSEGDNGMACYIDFRNVTDFYGNKLESVGIDAKSFNVSLDKRIPTIDVDQVNASSDKPKNSPNVPLNLNHFSGGAVYYEWVKEENYNSYVGDNANSFEVLNKLKQHAQNSNYPLAGFSRITNASQDGSTKTQVTFNSSTENGKFYLICYVEPLFKISNESNIKIYTFGTYLVDNKKPDFSDLQGGEIHVLDSGGFNRKFSFVVTDDNGIDTVTALVKETGKPNAKVNRTDLPVDDGGRVNYTLDLQTLIDKFYTNSEGVIIVDPGAGFYDINFEIKDKAGNITNVYNTYQSMYLSILPYFDAKVDFVPNDEVTSPLDGNIYLPGSTVKGYAKDENLRKTAISVSINGSEYKVNDTESEKYQIVSVNESGSYSINVTFDKPGYYEIKFLVSGAYSDMFALYVTDNYQEETETYKKAYSNELLLINKVVQLSENVQYLFINNEKQIEREYYGGAINPTFSSDASCLIFLKFYEYQDLKYEVLTTNTASYLNTGSGEGYNKASGESKTAMSGQVWIRYKRSSWDVSSESINDWAYYFYKESDDGSNTIDIDLLSENLKNAIDGICQKICSKNGKNPNAYDLYLVDDEHLNSKTRAPQLSEAQIALSRPDRFETSKCGTTLVNATYSGDPNLFENTIRMKVGGNNYDLPVATNLLLNCSKETRLFVSPYSESDLNFVEFKLKEGMTLRDALNSIGSSSSVICSSGVYVLRELDKNGGSEFYVYVDADAPKLGIRLNDSETVEYIDSKEVANLFASKITLTSIGDEYDGDNTVYTELDKNAYVALFKMPGQVLYAIYFRGEIPNEKVEEGTYLVHIGDRSGNFYSFKIYVSDSAPKVEFRAYETKFSIKITNRSADELQSLEIYCNDVLVSSKLLTEQVFTQNGEYRVVIKDKYSTNEYVESEDFTREQPSVDFFYDEKDDGFFSRYKDGFNDFMAIQNEEDYKLVSTSRRLKIKINSDECDFEIKGLLPADYSYNETTHEIELRKIAPFYLDIWNREQTEDIISYKVIVDNYAPNIQVFTDNRKIAFDESQVGSYDTADMTKPSSIKYVTSNEVVEVLVMQDDIITNDYVKATIKDDTAIKEVRVYQLNKLIKTYVKDDVAYDGSMVFYIGNVVGEVKIVALDLFGNTTSFVFAFGDKKISEAFVDGEKVGSKTDGVYYGNDSAYIDISPNTETHILYDYNGERINQVFKFEDNKLYIGKYTYSGSKYGVVDFFNGGMKTTDENGDVQYVDKPLTLDANNTYKPFEDLELYIICTPETGYIRITLNSEEVKQKITVRVNKDNTVAEYYEIELSKEAAKLDFESSVGSVVVSNGYVYSSTDQIEIKYDLTKITEIKVAFNSVSNDFDEDGFVYTISDMFENGEGYYCLKSVNVYGTVTCYYLIYSSSINASVDLSYLDKDNEIYSIAYADEFFTNYRATVKGYKLKEFKAVTDDDSSIISAIKNGEEEIIVIEKSAVVTLEDIYGNKKIIHVYVSTDQNFKYDSDNEWISGYSELANSQEGYSNTKLTVNLTEDQINSFGIVQIKVFGVTSVKTIYGYDGTTFIGYDANNFIEVIGLDGTGVYNVVFSDKYGDVIKREIHYCEESTLIIKRQTSSSVTEEEINTEDAIKSGVWSNREIILSSVLSNGKYYRFYVKADAEEEYREVSLPYTFQLASTSQNGRLKYSVKYVDAYGYSYEIECNLNKRDIDYTAVNMSFIKIDQVEYTKDPIQINFNGDCTATYTLNSFEEVAYLPNEIIYKDGNYTFTIKDNSGNVKTVNFTKDSSCRFKIITQNGEVEAYNGGVINAGQLVFDNMGDTSYIKYAKFNGNLIDVNEDTYFSKTGLYELIIEDAVLNKSYFKFYLVNHSINEFLYDVPDNYVISEVYRTYNDARSPYLDAVDGEKKQLRLSEVGKYDVILKNVYRDSTTNFSIEINVDKPTAKLVGCEENAVTTNDITLKDVGIDDVVEIYKNGELIARYDSENGETLKAITEGGKYKVVVTNAQGVSTELCFVKKNIANVSLSILIIIICFLSASGFFIGLLFRNRSKFDN